MTEKLRAPQMAKLLGISKSTLYQWCEQRELPFFKVGGTLLFDEQEIEEWLEKKRVEVE